MRKNKKIETQEEKELKLKKKKKRKTVCKLGLCGTVLGLTSGYIAYKKVKNKRDN